MSSYLMIDEDGEVTVLAAQPTVEEVKDSMCVFISGEIIRGEVAFRKAIVCEADGEEEEDELDWELLR